MVLNLTRFAVLLGGDRLIAAVLHRGRLETFFVEAEQPAAALRAEIDARKLHLTSAAVGLPRSSVTVKPVELPEIGGDLREMVRFELERHLPFPADDAPFDFIPVPSDADGAARAVPGRRVVVVAADRRVLDTALRLLDDARLRPASLTVAAHELVNLVDHDPKRRIVWMHRAGQSIDLLLVAGSTTLLSRNVSAEDGDVAGEIRRSLTLLRWRQCDAIWVSGDVSAADAPSGIDTLGVPVSEPPYSKRAQHLLAGLEHDGRGARELAAALAMGRGARPLDLLPLAMRPRRITRGQAFSAGSAAMAIALVIAAFLVPGYRDTRRLAQTDAAINQLGPDVHAVERTIQDLERKRRLLVTIESVQAGAMKPLPVLRDLTELLPGDAWLTMLSVDKNGVELTGQAAAASALIPVLENSPRLERVEFASPVTRGRDREQFRILAKWEGNGATATALPEAAPVASPTAQRGSARTPQPPGGAVTAPPGADSDGTARTNALPPRRRGPPSAGDVREPRP